MSWHFSQALEAEYLAERCSDGEPFAQWKSIPSAADDSCSAKMKATCHRSPFGMMFVHSTDDHGVGLLTSFRAASRARTSALQGKALESTGHGLGCGESSLGSLARYDRDSRSWKTPQCWLLAELGRFLETFPRWGLMRDGECFQLAPSVRHTHGKGCSLWPTPTRSQAKRGWGLGSQSHGPTGHSRYAEDGEAVRNVRKDISLYGWKLDPMAHEWLMGWPLGWTGSLPLGTDKFQQWLRSHGEFCQEE